MDPKTRGVYLVRVWDRRGTMHEIFVDAPTSEPMIYDCAELYEMRLSIDSLRICYSVGNPTDYYAIDDVRLVFPQGGYVITNNQSERKRH